MSTSIPKTAGLVTIRYIVASTLNRLGDYSMKQYKRYAQICIECFSEEMAMFHIGNTVEVIYTHMSVAKTLTLPSDYIQWRKVGYPSGGKLKVITHDSNILLPRTFDDTGEAVGNYYGTPISSLAISNVIFFSDHYRNGQFIGGLFGMPGGVDDCYFRIDEESNPKQMIFFGETPRSEVVIEYLGTGLKPSGGSLIPRECVAPLRNYILWQRLENDQRVAFNEKERRKREYEESIEAMRSFKLSFTKDEYMQMVYSGTHQSIKR